MKKFTEKEYAKREKIFIDLMRNHRGEENSINYADIITIMNTYGFKMSHDCLRNFITQIKLKNRLPIVYTRGKGYFWAKRKSEIENTIKDLILMQSSLQEQVDLLREFVME